MPPWFLAENSFDFGIYKKNISSEKLLHFYEQFSCLKKGEKNQAMLVKMQVWKESLKGH